MSEQSPKTPSSHARSIGGVIDLNEMSRLQQEHLVVVRKHPTLQLFIANYRTHKGKQAERFWTPTRELARGLIYDPDGKIIARPFSRMGEIGENDAPPNNYAAFEKIDGSLGISYPTPSGMRIASRGNFEGDVSELGSKLLEAVRYDFGEGVTALWEIVDPNRPHVIKYHNRKDMTLIGLIENATGKELDLPKQEDVDYPVVQDLGALSLAELRAMDNGNREGFVLRLKNPAPNQFDRYKLKLLSYQMDDLIQREAAGYLLWLSLKNGTVGSLLSKLPKGSRAQIATEKIVQGWYHRYDEAISQAQLKLNQAKELSPREQLIVDVLRKNPDTSKRNLQGIWDAIAPPRPSNVRKLPN